MAQIKLKEPTHHQYLLLYTVTVVFRCNRYTNHRLINCQNIIIISCYLVIAGTDLQPGTRDSPDSSYTDTADLLQDAAVAAPGPDAVRLGRHRTTVSRHDRWHRYHQCRTLSSVRIHHRFICTSYIADRLLTPFR